MADSAANPCHAQLVQDDKKSFLAEWMQSARTSLPRVFVRTAWENVPPVMQHLVVLSRLAVGVELTVYTDPTHPNRYVIPGPNGHLASMIASAHFDAAGQPHTGVHPTYLTCTWRQSGSTITSEALDVTNEKNVARVLQLIGVAVAVESK